MIQRAGKMLALHEKVEPNLLAEINKPIVLREKYLEISAKYESWARKSRGQTP
jgi:hypothetical protein